MTELGLRVLLLGLLIVVGFGCSSKPSPVPHVVILGFDGVDPDRVEALWAEGKLPHLKRLAEDGAFARLGTTQPPQSPVAWSSFATGTHPGKHGIYDFIARDPRSYLPKMGAVEYRTPDFDAAGKPRGRIEGSNLRRGKPFWQLLSEQGIEVEVLNVPYSYPPEPVPLGGVASGLGVPDLRPTNSTSTVFSTDFGEEPPRPGGVRTVPVAWADGRASVHLEGPRGADRKRTRVPVSLRRDAAVPGSLTIELRGASILLEAGAWSEWQTIHFDLGPRTRAAAQVRFFLEEASEGRLHLYASALGADPADPWVELSHPPSLAVELQERAGRYNTVGWKSDTSALNAELLPEAAFLDDLLRTMDQREAMTLAALEDGGPPLLISVWTGTDRVAHMFWRLTSESAPRYDAALAAEFGGAIDRTYEKMDAAVGRIRARLAPETLLMVLSDHGFHGFDRSVHLNRWLIDQGYLVLAPGGRSLQDADWSRTRAYALGTGQIYLNLKGREGQGTVEFGPEREALLGELVAGLRGLRDPDRDVLVFREVQIGAELYRGPAAAGAPDLLLGFMPGYQASWATRLGGAPEGLFEDNLKKWSGDHAASSAADTEGVLFLNRSLSSTDVGIEDVAPTVLRIFGKELPPEMDGGPIL